MEKIDKKEPENARNLAKIGRNFEAKCLKFRKIFLATLAESLRSFTFAKPSFKETREGKNFKFSFHFWTNRFCPGPTYFIDLFGTMSSKMVNT